MRSINRGLIFALAVALASLSSIDAKAPQKIQRFVPNYIVLEDITLSAPNGNPRDSLQKGTLVSAREMGDVLDVRAKDGKFGFAEKRFFSRLGNTIEITNAATQIGESSNRFAFALYHQVRRQNGNLFLSPASLSTALAMTYGGAKGMTRQEMSSVLHFHPEQDPHDGFATLLQILNSTGSRGGYSLATANRLWGAEGYQFDASFLRLTEDKYRAELESLDFRNPERARRTINNWVEKQTRKKIVDLISAGVLQENTRLVLTNAIYFEGGWASEFSKQATQKATFHLTAEETIDVLTMEQQKNFPYTEDADAQVLALPYRGNELSMVVVLPKKNEGLATVESNLTNDRYEGWMKDLGRARPIITYLPKFKLKSQFRLSGALKSMGMKTAFSHAADFSAMSKNERLSISAVIHQAFVEVDEVGTEAAAATAIGVAPTASIIEDQEPPEPITFRADHPFLFMIRDNRTSAILFMGRMQHPVDSL